MTFHPSWNLVDVFSVGQAGYLWHELEPPADAFREITNPRPSHVAAVIQALQHLQQYEYSEKAGTVELVAKQLFTDPFKTMRTREQLKQFAKSKRQYPRFLFDTLGPTNEDLAEQFIKSGPAPGPPAQADEPTAEKSKGGRPEGYDWNAATVEIIRVAELDGLPKKQSVMVRHLKTWFANTYQSVPGDTQIKGRVSAIYNGLKESGCIPEGEVSD